jgi:hypothetical protein
MMQLDKIDMSDPKTVAAVVAIGVLGLGMCIQLVFLFATLLKSDKKPLHNSCRSGRDIDVARHIRGYHLTEETGVQNACR